MKTCLATQVLSQSVSCALRFCSETLKLPQFQGTEATAEFLEMFDVMFDVMNSSSAKWIG